MARRTPGPGFNCAFVMPFRHQIQPPAVVVGLVVVFTSIAVALDLGSSTSADLRPPACGIPAAPASRPYPLTVSALPDDLTNITQVPWHVGIYNNTHPPYQPMHRCGGTLLSERVVITAAHCVWDIEPAYLVVGLGKYYRPWDTAQPLAHQKIWVTDIRTPGKYDARASSGDLALLILKEPVVFNRHIQPICLDAAAKVAASQRSHESDGESAAVGLVAGWGLLRSENVKSLELKVVHINAVERAECLRMWPNQTVGVDQLCGAYTLGQGVCDGDDGGALAMPRIVTGGGRAYYLRGVVGGLGYMDGLCNRDTPTVFTDVRPHLAWIRDVVGQQSEHSSQPPSGRYMPRDYAGVTRLRSGRKWCRTFPKPSD